MKLSILISGIIKCIIFCFNYVSMCVSPVIKQIKFCVLCIEHSQWESAVEPIGHHTLYDFHWLDGVRRKIIGCCTAPRRTIVTVETAHYASFAITQNLCACLLDIYSSYFFPLCAKITVNTIMTSHIIGACRMKILPVKLWLDVHHGLLNKCRLAAHNLYLSYYSTHDFAPHNRWTQSSWRTAGENRIVCGDPRSTRTCCSYDIARP